MAKNIRAHAWVCLPDCPQPPRPAARRGWRRAVIAGLALAGILGAAAAGAVALHSGRSGAGGGTGAPVTGPAGTTGPVPSGTAPGADTHPYGGDPGPPNPGAKTGPGPTPGDPRPPARSGPAGGTASPAIPTTAKPSLTTTRTSPSVPPRLDDPVQEQRPVELRAEPGWDSVEVDWWRQNHDGTGDLQMDPAGLFTVKGATLSVIADSPEPTRDQCRQVQQWTTRVDFAALHAGSQLCARSMGGRYAMITVRALPDSQGSKGSVVFYGKTWALAG